jgi:DNA-binding protein HU-beta
MATEKKPMSKTQVVADLAEGLGMTKADVNTFLTALMALATAEVKSKGMFTFPGLGKLVKAHRKARMGRNPATGESIRIAAKTVVKFRLSKVMKDAVIPPKK